MPAKGGSGGLAARIVLALLSGFRTGCAPFAPLIQAPSPQILEEPPVAGWGTEKLLQILDQRDRQFRSVRSLASISYRGPEGRQGFQEAILVQRPDRARLETLSMVGAIP